MGNNSIDILLVEDNPNDIELTFRALRKQKLEERVFVVRDGAEALDFLFCRGSYIDRDIKKIPKVILLDLKLPKINGFEVLEKVKTDTRTKTIPTVMLTSSAEEKDIIRSYQLNANSFIVKPIDFDNYMQAITEVGLYWTLRNKYLYDK